MVPDTRLVIRARLWLSRFFLWRLKHCSRLRSTPVNWLSISSRTFQACHLGEVVPAARGKSFLPVCLVICSPLFVARSLGKCGFHPVKIIKLFKPSGVLLGPCILLTGADSDHIFQPLDSVFGGRMGGEQLAHFAAGQRVDDKHMCRSGVGLFHWQTFTVGIKFRQG